MSSASFTRLLPGCFVLLFSNVLSAQFPKKDLARLMIGQKDFRAKMIGAKFGIVKDVKLLLGPIVGGDPQYVIPDLQSQYFIKSARENRLLDRNTGPSRNVYAHKPHHGENQQWYFRRPKKPAYSGAVLIHCVDNKQPLDRDGKQNIYTHAIHENKNQQFIILPVKNDSNLVRIVCCADLSTSLDMDLGESRNVYMHKTHTGNNQVWILIKKN